MMPAEIIKAPSWGFFFITTVSDYKFPVSTRWGQCHHPVSLFKQGYIKS
jgi:hypothetical protein